jgi:hypothetical protein
MRPSGAPNAFMGVIIIRFFDIYPATSAEIK